MKDQRKNRGFGPINKLSDIPREKVTIMCNRGVLSLLGMMIEQNFEGIIEHYKEPLKLLPTAVEELESIVQQMKGAFFDDVGFNN